MSNTHNERYERTSVSLPRSLALRLRHQAAARGTAISEVVRDALTEYLDRQEPPPVPSFAGIGASGEKDGSERVDEIVAARFERRKPK